MLRELSTAMISIHCFYESFSCEVHKDVNVTNQQYRALPGTNKLYRISCNCARLARPYFTFSAFQVATTALAVATCENISLVFLFLRKSGKTLWFHIKNLYILL